jgi:rod shape-determining protein MreD
MAARASGGAGPRVLGVAALAALSWVALSVGLAPMASGLWPLPGPDLLFCVAAFWVARRPAEAPAAAVLALGLVRDLVSGGPLGAGALGLLAATETLRRRGPALRRRGLALEWPAAAAAAALATALPAALVWVALAPAPEASALAAAALSTALAYGPVAVALRHGLRLRSLADPSEGDAMFARRRP